MLMEMVRFPFKNLKVEKNLLANFLMESFMLSLLLEIWTMMARSAFMKFAQIIIPSADEKISQLKNSIRSGNEVAAAFKMKKQQF